jgi:hypothetical protein
MSYADKLAELEDDFNNADPLGTNAHPPYGQHQAKVTSAKMDTVKKGKNEGAPIVKFAFKLSSGQNAFKNLVLAKDNPTALGILKGDMEIMGYKLTSLKSLLGAGGVLRKVIGLMVDINIVQNTDPRFYSVYINKVVEEIGDEEEVSELEDEDEEEEVVIDDDDEEEEEPAPKPRAKKKKKKKSSKKASKAASKPVTDDDADDDLEGFGEDDEDFDLDI